MILKNNPNYIQLNINILFKHSLIAFIIKIMYNNYMNIHMSNLKNDSTVLTPKNAREIANKISKNDQKDVDHLAYGLINKFMNTEGEIRFQEHYNKNDQYYQLYKNWRNKGFEKFNEESDKEIEESYHSIAKDSMMLLFTNELPKLIDEWKYKDLDSKIQEYVIENNCVIGNNDVLEVLLQTRKKKNNDSKIPRMTFEEIENMMIKENLYKYDNYTEIIIAYAQGTNGATFNTFKEMRQKWLEAKIQQLTEEYIDYCKTNNILTMSRYHSEIFKYVDHIIDLALFAIENDLDYTNKKINSKEYELWIKNMYFMKIDDIYKGSCFNFKSYSNLRDDKLRHNIKNINKADISMYIIKYILRDNVDFNVKIANALGANNKKEKFTTKYKEITFTKEENAQNWIAYGYLLGFMKIKSGFGYLDIMETNSDEYDQWIFNSPDKNDYRPYEINTIARIESRYYRQINSCQDLFRMTNLNQNNLNKIALKAIQNSPSPASYLHDFAVYGYNYESKKRKPIR